MNSTMSPSSLCSSSSSISRSSVNSKTPLVLSLSEHPVHAHHRRMRSWHSMSNRVIRSSLMIDSSQVQLQHPQVVSSGDPNSDSSARRLILLRHAHSSWDDRSIRDHDRPLSRPGKADAISVSHKLQQLGWIPQLILSSDAARTQETLRIMQEEVRGFLQAQVHFISSFYSVSAMDGQTAQHLQRVICEYAKDHISTVMCMGHNRGWEEAASLFTGAPVELKTCNAALLEASGKNWEEAFLLAGIGGWRLHGIVKPSTNL